MTDPSHFDRSTPRLKHAQAEAGPRTFHDDVFTTSPDPLQNGVTHSRDRVERNRPIQSQERASLHRRLTFAAIWDPDADEMSTFIGPSLLAKSSSVSAPTPYTARTVVLDQLSEGGSSSSGSSPVEKRVRICSIVDEGFFDAYNHGDCEPHLDSRFSVTTSSTSNYVEVDFPDEEAPVAPLLNHHIQHSTHTRIPAAPVPIIQTPVPMTPTFGGNPFISQPATLQPRNRTPSRPNTPNSKFVPPWASSSSVSGRSMTPGSPHRRGVPTPWVTPSSSHTHSSSPSQSPRSASPISRFAPPWTSRSPSSSLRSGPPELSPPRRPALGASFSFSGSMRSDGSNASPSPRSLKISSSVTSLHSMFPRRKRDAEWDDEWGWVSGKGLVELRTIDHDA